MRFLLKNILSAILTLAVFVGCLSLLDAENASDKGQADGFAANLSDESLCADCGWLQKGDILQPSQIVLPTMDRQSTVRAHTLSNKQIFHSFAPSVGVVDVKIKENTQISERRKSHLMQAGYYIYQLRKIII